MLDRSCTTHRCLDCRSESSTLFYVLHRSYITRCCTILYSLDWISSVGVSKFAHRRCVRVHRLVSLFVFVAGRCLTNLHRLLLAFYVPDGSYITRRRVSLHRATRLHQGCVIIGWYLLASFAGFPCLTVVHCVEFFRRRDWIRHACGVSSSRLGVLACR